MSAPLVDEIDVGPLDFGDDPHDYVGKLSRGHNRGRYPAEYVFPGPDGGPMRNDWFRWRFDKACTSARLSGISPKTLRHPAGSLALASGASVVTVQKERLQPHAAR